MKTSLPPPLLRLLSKSGFIAWKQKPVRFKSGLRSHVYVGGRDDLTMHLELLSAIGDVIAKRVWSLTPAKLPPCLIGIPSAGRTLAQAAAAGTSGRFPFLVLREKKKSYGAHRQWVDGKPNRRFSYFTIDNTITDGTSKFETFERLREDGYPAKRMLHLILVDREEGGMENLRLAGYRAETIWKLPDLIRAFGAHGIWPESRVATALAEIAANKKLVLA